MRIGFVGYSGQKFDEKIARALVEHAFAHIATFDDAPIVVSGLTDLGIPHLVYEYADAHGLVTVGIACEKAYDNPCFPVDVRIISGKEWGDESETFLDYIEALIRIGGGKQSHRETEAARLRDIPVYEYELAALP